MAQEVLNPLQQALAGGCHLTRDTLGRLCADVTYVDGTVAPRFVNFKLDKVCCVAAWSTSFQFIFQRQWFSLRSPRADVWSTLEMHRWTSVGMLSVRMIWWAAGGIGGFRAHISPCDRPCAAV